MEEENSSRWSLTKTFAICISSFVVVVIFLKWRPIYNRIFAFAYCHFDEKLRKAGSRSKKELFELLREQKSQSKDEPFIVVEIGAGIGTNFSFFPEGCEVIAVEPNDACVSYLKQHAADFPHVRLLRTVTTKGEEIKNEIPDNSASALVCTLTMCSCDDPNAFLKEVKRILKPGGTFYYYEHVIDGTWNSWLHIGQSLVWPYMKYIAECDVLRSTWSNIDRAGFSKVTYKRFYAEKWPFFLRPQLLGTAVK